MSQTYAQRYCSRNVQRNNEQRYNTQHPQHQRQKPNHSQLHDPNFQIYLLNKIRTISDFILDSCCYASTPLQASDNLDFYFYNGQYYELGAEAQIEAQIKQNFRDVKLAEKTISKIITEVQRQSKISDQFDKDKNLTCYLNGIHNKTDDHLYPFSPRYLLTHQINQKYIDNSNSLSQFANKLAALNYID